MDKNEGNEVLAEFMSAGLVHPNDRKYHNNWNWLIPVVEKIERIRDDHHGYFGVHISSNNCTIQATNFRSGTPLGEPPYYFADWYGGTKIEATWNACVHFIKWYNAK